MSDLKHFGILGMKWGRSKGTTASKSSADHTKVKTLKGKKLSEMSNEELKTLTTRMQLEKQYKDLKSGDLSRGQKLVDKVLGRVGDRVLSNTVDKAIDTGLTKAIDFVVKKVVK